LRREFWAYAADETLSKDEMIAEKYRGIRSAPGYPCQPDHTEKATLLNYNPRAVPNSWRRDVIPSG